MKFIYSEKATKFCEISTLPLSYVVTVKSKVEILQNFVAFSVYMNFNVHQPIMLKIYIMYKKMKKKKTFYSMLDIENTMELQSLWNHIFSMQLSNATP